jgi:hypothetical protein
MKRNYRNQDVEISSKEDTPGKWSANADFKPRLKSGVGTDSISVPPSYSTQADAENAVWEAAKERIDLEFT